MNLDYLLDNSTELVAILLALGGITYFVLKKRQEWMADGKITLDEILDDVGEIASEVKETIADVKESLTEIEENEAAKEAVPETVIIEEVTAEEEE